MGLTRWISFGLIQGGLLWKTEIHLSEGGNGGSQKTRDPDGSHHRIPNNLHSNTVTVPSLHVDMRAPLGR